MSENISLNHKFLEPLKTVLEECAARRICPKHSDLDFLLTGITRSLEPVVSGREFLQLRFDSPETSWKRSNYFEANKSGRRLDLVREVADELAAHVARKAPAWQWPDNLPELDEFDIHLADGHYHKAAAHDPKDAKGKSVPVGHFFARDLRRGVLRHFDTAVASDGKNKEHDMSLLKRMDTQILRCGAPRGKNGRKGRKVLLVYDRAGIDFGQWQKWKHTAALYFLSRTKEGIADQTLGLNEWDRDDPRNNGVVADRIVYTTVDVSVRRVDYIDPATGKAFSFLTNLPTKVPPGIVAWLYERRWDVEKTFDEMRNRLCEGKAWGKTITAKRMQGAFISIVYNLLLLLNEGMRAKNELPEEPFEEKRREKRRAEREKEAEDAGRAPNYNLQKRPWITQMGCKFIRWLRRHFAAETSYVEAVANLQLLYDEF